MANAMVEDMHEDSVYRRVEVITGRRRRRNWTTQEKTRIAAESFEPHANISEIARRYGVSRGLLSVWRRQVREQASSSTPEPMFATVRIESDANREATAIPPHNGGTADVVSSIEVEICGAIVRIPKGADRPTLEAVIWTLRGTR
jgi:transposase